MTPKILLLLLLWPCLPSLAQVTESPAQPATDPAVELAQTIAKTVAEFRGLPLKNPVDVATSTIEELRQDVAAMLRAEMPPDVAASACASWQILGLLPRPFDLLQSLEGLLVEQVGGFYDPKTRRLRTIARGEDDPAAKMAGKMGMSPDTVAKTIMAHELVHALQDQHFNLNRFVFEAQDEEDDLMLALSAVVEGDATVAMFGDMLGNADGKAVFARAKSIIPVLRLQGSGSAMAMSAEGMQAIAAAPKSLQERFMFPYLKGAIFCLQAGDEGRGFPAVDALYRKPPLSTEQILHPKKYLGEEPDWPTTLALPDLLDLLPQSSARLTSNTVGEMLLGVAFQEHLERKVSREAAAGWDGDRYALFGVGEQRFLAWIITFDTETDAIQAEDALGQWVVIRRENGNPDTWTTKRQGLDLVATVNWPKDTAAAAVTRILESTLRAERSVLPERRK